MQTKTTLLLNKSRLFGPNERREWAFRIWFWKKKFSNTPGLNSVGQLTLLCTSHYECLYLGSQIHKNFIKDKITRNKHFAQQVHKSWTTMWFLFVLQLISELLMFQPAKCASCDQADWSVSLDRATWSTCPKRNTYLRGLWRSPRKAGDERVGRIEYGRCCKAIEPSYTNEPATCSNANWLHTLDRWVVRKMTISDSKAQENIAGSKLQNCWNEARSSVY